MPRALSDTQRDAVLRAAEALHVADRALFVEAVAAALHDCPEPGDGEVYRAVRKVLRQLFRPPALGREQSKYR
jgi:hypothetical protein